MKLSTWTATVLATPAVATGVCLLCASTAQAAPDDAGSETSSAAASSAADTSASSSTDSDDTSANSTATDTDDGGDSVGGSDDAGDSGGLDGGLPLFHVPNMHHDARSSAHEGPFAGVNFSQFERLVSLSSPNAVLEPGTDP